MKGKLLLASLGRDGLGVLDDLRMKQLFHCFLRGQLVNGFLFRGGHKYES